MATEYVLAPNMTITNVERVIDEIIDQAGQIVSLSDFDTIKEYISKNENTIFYFDNSYIEKDMFSRNTAVKVLVDIGILNHKGTHLFLALLKEGENEYRGYFVQTIRAFFESGKRYFTGTESTYKKRYNDFQERFKSIAATRTDKVLSFTSCNIIEEPEPDPYKPIEPKPDESYYRNMDYLTPELKSLLNKNEWALDEGLDRHIKIIGDKIKVAIEKDLAEYYVINKIKDVVVNTGLMDKFGNYILIMYRYNKTHDGYRPNKIMYSKQDFLNNGFSKEQSSQGLSPIPNIIADELRSGISSDFGDYDISFDALKHIIIDRRERFPEGSEIFSEKDLADKIKKSLREGVDKLRIDPNYAKPIYSAKTSCISWVFPLKILAGAEERPEMVMLVRKEKEFYSLKTVLPYDEEMKDRIRSARLYQSEW